MSVWQNTQVRFTAFVFLFQFALLLLQAIFSNRGLYWTSVTIAFCCEYVHYPPTLIPRIRLLVNNRS